jgi:5-carboxymethyl-2-hydroxymuconate isomerase
MYPFLFCHVEFMPSCIIEYPQKFAENLHIEKLCSALHQVMLDSKLFAPEAIKTRAISYDHLCMGDDFAQHPFLHVTVALMSGRPIEAKKLLSYNLHHKMREMNPDLARLSVEIRDMDKECFTK